MEILAADFATVMGQWVWPVFLFMLTLSMVVFVHELGHFLVAKWAGIKVEQFALGFWKKLAGFHRGETEYRINVIPLGGYVKMLGQDDFDPAKVDEADPRSWQRASPGRKIAVLSAGAIMNVVFAACAFVIVYVIGIRFVAPVIGSVQPGMPAATVVLPDSVARAMGVERAVGLRPGDEVRAVDGKPIRRFLQLQMAGILSAKDERFRLTVARTIAGREVIFDVALEPKADELGHYGTHYAFGIGAAVGPVIDVPGQDGYAGEARFRENDRIVSLAGRPVAHSWELIEMLRDCAGEGVEVIVEREGERTAVKLAPFRISGGPDEQREEQLVLIGMSPRVRVSKVVGKPAEHAEIEPGDVITDYAGRGAPSRAELLKVSKDFVDQAVPIQVLRKGSLVDLKIIPVKDGEQVLIGIASAPEQDIPYVARVIAGSPAAGAGITEGAVLTKVNDTPVGSWAQVYAALRSAMGKQVELTYTLGEKSTTSPLGVLTPEVFDPRAYVFGTPAIAAFEQLRTEVIWGNPLEALVWGAEDTWMWMVTVYKTLRSITTGRVSPKGLSGPVGIASIGVKIARKGAMDLAYFVAMLSVMVGLFNLLPLPVLDGGHVVLALVEKLRGRALSVRFQTAWQITGMVFVFGLLLALTYNDIARFFKR